MNICLKSCINQIPKSSGGIRYAIQEMYDNLTQTFARIECGDVTAIDEFRKLYCMNEDIKEYITENNLELAK